MKEAQRRYYDEAYELVNGTGVGGYASRMYHRELEKKFDTETRFERILEVGAGHGEHAGFVKHKFDEYFVSDLEVDQVNLAQMKSIESSLLHKGKIVVQGVDVQSIKFEDNHFDRTLSTCLFHHLPQPELAFKELRRVTKSGGYVSIYLPSDPGFLYRLAQYFGTGIKMKKSLKKLSADFSVGYLRGIEHRNHVLSLQNMLKEVFSNDSITAIRRPIPFFSWNFSFFTIYQIQLKK